VNIGEMSHPADEKLLSNVLHTLNNEGKIEYHGEFGDELTTFIPFVAWLKANNFLKGKKVVTYSGMRAFYFFLSDEEFSTKQEDRVWIPPAKRTWPGHDGHSSDRFPWRVYPDYRRRYASEGRNFERPVLFIQNKFAVEWDWGPINYLPLEVIEFLLQRATKRFHVIYSRPKAGLKQSGYSYDDNVICDYPDLQIVRRFPEVEIFEESCLNEDIDYNTAKLQVFSKTYHFISVQGGGAHLMAYFNNSVLLILHRVGREYPNVYQGGKYKYLSDPPPLLLVSRTVADFIAGVQAVLTSDAGATGVHTNGQCDAIVRKLAL
jgi:hypothetical protein